MNEKELLKEIYDVVKRNVKKYHTFNNHIIKDATGGRFLNSLDLLEIFEKHNYKPEPNNDQ